MKMDSRFDSPEDPLAGFELDPEDDRWISGLRRAEARATSMRVGGYRLLSSIEGGQGVVYRATRDDGSPDVALKRLGRGLFATESMKRRFEREVAATLDLDHPNIVRVHGTEEIESHLVLVMDWIDGLPLDRHVGAVDPRREPEPIVELFLDLCDAVQYAHQRGVLHRDLKPSNVIVDREGRPRLLDFGLARRLAGEDDTLTRAGQFVGTPAYASPEQVAGLDVPDVRSDVYSLGVMLFELLCGELPVARGTQTVRRLREVRRDLDPALERIIERTLAQAPADRYSSVAALAEDLRRFLRHEPIAADALHTARRMRALVVRHRVIATALVLIGAGVSVWAVVQSRHRTELEGKQRQLEFTIAVARNNTEQATQTLEFFIDEIIDRADPLYSASGFSLQEILLAAEARIGQLTTYRKMIVLESLARSFASLDELERSEKYLRDCLAVDISLRGDVAPFTTARKSALARVLVRMGRFDEADRLLQDARRVVAGEVEAPRILGVSLWESLGRYQIATGDARGAIVSFGRMTETFETTAGKAVPWWSDAEYEQVRALLAFSGALDAERRIAELLAQPTEPAISPSYPKARLEVLRAQCDRMRGRLRDAEAGVRAAIEALRTRLGPDHTHLCEAELELAWIRLEAGALDDAATIVEDVAKRLRPNRAPAAATLEALRVALSKAQGR